MIAHLPECRWQQCTHGSLHCRCYDCICDELRACEQRVLSAAREQIMRLPYEIDEGFWIDRNEVLLWIDHLREGND